MGRKILRDVNIMVRRYRKIRFIEGGAKGQGRIAPIKREAGRAERKTLIILPCRETLRQAVFAIGKGRKEYTDVSVMIACRGKNFSSLRKTFPCIESLAIV